MSYPPQLDPGEIRAIRRLWISVLLQLCNDAASGQMNNGVAKDPILARRLLAGNSADLVELLELAGIDPAYFFDRVQPRLIAAIDRLRERGVRRGRGDANGIYKLARELGHAA